MQDNPQGLWIGPDGIGRAVRAGPDGRLKGGPLFEAFHGMERRRAGELTASRSDLARAYASAVWAYRCIKLRADAVAGVPLTLSDREGGPIPDHPLLDLLRDVNPHTMNLGDLLRATEAAYNIWGVAYWLKVRARGGPGGRRAVRWLQWLNPQTVEAVSDPARGITAYRQTVNGGVREIAPEDMVVFRNFDPLDDLGGLSPLSVALSEVNADLNAARFVAAFFANDARPAGLLTTDQPLHEAEVERARAWWTRLFGGARNRWKTGIVGGGLKWQTITFAPTDLALGDLRAEDRRAICAVFGVPPGLAGAWESTTYANAREQKASFYEDTILPQLGYIAEVLNWSLLPHYPDLVARGARLSWDVDGIAALRESSGDRARRLAALFAAGLVTRNEARARLGLAALPAEEDGFMFDLTADLATAAGAAPSGAGSGAETGRGALRDELKRWERFALKRVRAGRPVRAFESDVIPPDLQHTIRARLAQAQTIDDVFALFGEALEAVR